MRALATLRLTMWARVTSHSTARTRPPSPNVDDRDPLTDAALLPSRFRTHERRCREILGQLAEPLGEPDAHTTRLIKDEPKLLSLSYPLICDSKSENYCRRRTSSTGGARGAAVGGDPHRSRRLRLRWCRGYSSCRGEGDCARVSCVRPPASPEFFTATVDLPCAAAGHPATLIFGENLISMFRLSFSLRSEA
jgi:hypothetical protein